MVEVVTVEVGFVEAVESSVVSGVGGCDVITGVEEGVVGVGEGATDVLRGRGEE